MGLFNFDKNKILGTVFKAASSVLGTASRALGAAASASARVTKTAAAMGKQSRPTVQTTATAKPAPPVKPVQTTETEPALGKPIIPGSDKPAPPIMPEPLAGDTAAELAKLREEIEKLKSQRDFLLQAQQTKDNKPFGAAAISSDADTFQQQMDIKAAIDDKRAANPGADDKETRLQAIDEYYYAEDEGAGAPDLAGELDMLEPGPNPF